MGLLREAGVPEQQLQRWSGLALGLHRISGAVGATLAIVREEAARHARNQYWAIDLGHFAMQVSNEVGLRLESALTNAGVYFERRPQARRPLCVTMHSLSA